MHQVQPNIHRYGGGLTRSTSSKLNPAACSNQTSIPSNTTRGNSDSQLHAVSSDVLGVTSSASSSPGVGPRVDESTGMSTAKLSTSAPKRASGSIFDTLLPGRRASVAWVPDSLAEKCYHCHVYFSLVVRRHHCRRCGNVFCDTCTSSRMPVISQGFFTPVRVCEKCLKAAKRSRTRTRNARHESDDAADSNGNGYIDEEMSSIDQQQQLRDDLMNVSNLLDKAWTSSRCRATQAPFRRSRTADDDTFLDDQNQRLNQRPDIMLLASGFRGAQSERSLSSLWSDQDSEELLGLPTSTSTFRLKTLPGEIVMVRTENVRISFMERNQHTGTLCATNFRLVFNPDAPDGVVSSSSLASGGVLDLNLCLHPTHGVKEDELPYESDWDEPLNAYQAITLVSIERAKRKEVAETDMGVIDLVCKDFRHVQFFFDGLVSLQSFSQFDQTYNLIRQYAFGEPAGPMAEFAKFSMETYETTADGWKEYDPVEEFGRMGVNHANKWRISRLNQNYELCPSYPSLLAVPCNVSDHVLEAAAKFRTKGRIPVLSWRDPRTGAVICRSSQPLVGLGHKQCDRDVFLVQAIAAANFSSSRVVIIDARPWRNAVAQKTMARAGYELTAHYETRHLTASLKYADMDLSGQLALLRSQDAQEHTQCHNEPIDSSVAMKCVESSVVTECKLMFMGIENIHVMRKSYNKLLDLCISTTTTTTSSSEKWLEQLAASRWLEFLSRIIGSAVDIVRIIRDQNASVLVHCSDGWDRTTQLVSLAQVLLDPFYRTIHGFQVLIEKEWCSFGHKFRDRTGHGLSNSSSEIAPVFLQWIDCIWQCQKQFPSAFEFNERYLIFVLDHLYSCRFGTFLYDSEQERRDEETRRPTVSLWTFLNAMDRSVIVNPFYHAYEAPKKRWKASVTARRHCFEIPPVKKTNGPSSQPPPTGLGLGADVVATANAEASRWNPRPSRCEQYEQLDCSSSDIGSPTGIQSRSVSGVSLSSLASPSELSSCQSTPRGHLGQDPAVGNDMETLFDLEPVDPAKEEGFQPPLNGDGDGDGDGGGEPDALQDEEETRSSSCYHRIVRDLDSGLSFPQPVPSTSKLALGRLVSAPAAVTTTRTSTTATTPVHTPRKSTAPSRDQLNSPVQKQRSPSLSNVPSAARNNRLLQRRCSCPILSVEPSALHNNVRRASFGDEEDIATATAATATSATTTATTATKISSNEPEDHFHNDATHHVLFPRHSLKILRFWTSYYLRWDCSSHAERDANVELEISHRDVLSQLQKAHEKIETLQQVVASKSPPSPLVRGAVSSAPTTPAPAFAPASAPAHSPAGQSNTLECFLTAQNQRLESMLMSYEDQFSRVLLRK